MLILISLIVALIIGIVLYVVGEDSCIDVIHGLGAVLMVVAGVLLAVAIMTLSISRYNINAQIQAYHSTISTIETARANGIDLEDAAIQHKIIELNRELAEVQYYNTTIFDIWIPDEVMDLEPIK